MSMKRKNFSYNTDIDSDIEEWFDSLPPKKHSYYVRKAIKHYINKNENDLQKEILAEVQEIKQSIKVRGFESNFTEDKNDEELLDENSTQRLLKETF